MGGLPALIDGGLSFAVLLCAKDFELPYDYLVVSVGATTNTFNTPGVKEHCIFLKQVQDAQKLRNVGSRKYSRFRVLLQWLVLVKK